MPAVSRVSVWAFCSRLVVRLSGRRACFTHGRRCSAFVACRTWLAARAFPCCRPSQGLARCRPLRLLFIGAPGPVWRRLYLVAARVGSPVELARLRCGRGRASACSLAVARGHGRARLLLYAVVTGCRAQVRVRGVVSAAAGAGRRVAVS